MYAGLGELFHTFMAWEGIPTPDNGVNTNVGWLPPP